MDNIRIFKKPRDLLEWIEENDLFMNIKEEDAKLLLGYMDGYGFSLGEKEGKLVRIDLSNPSKHVDYTIDDVIDSVCDLNFAVLLDLSSERKACKNFIKSRELKIKVDLYKTDQKALDSMFEKTYYGKVIKEYVEQTSIKLLKEDKEMNYELGKKEGGRKDGRYNTLH